MLFWIIATLMAMGAVAFALPAFVVRSAPAVRPATAPGDAGAQRRGAGLALAPLVLLPAFAFGLYAVYGDPGAMRGEAAARLFGDDAAQAVPPSREDLLRHLERSPRDGRGWVLLARMEFGADRFGEAATAYDRAVAVDPKVAGDPAVWCEYADALGMTQGGALAGKPRELVSRALALNPAFPAALEMAGGAAFEAQDYPLAARYWRELLAQLPAQARARIELEAAIARADGLASR
jgi:cytochrome c-type biogenesis protein CcmH